VAGTTGEEISTSLDTLSIDGSDLSLVWQHGDCTVHEQVWDESAASDQQLGWLA